MWKIISLFLPLWLLAGDLEVRLSTRSNLKPLYLEMKGELREILEADLNAGGFCTVVNRKVPLQLIVDSSQGQLKLTVLTQQKTSKIYPPIPLEREAIHRLSDQIHKDLFGVQGIASLRLIYTQRTKNPTDKGLDFLSEVWICDADGENARQLTKENNYCLSPYFVSADEFCYVCEKSGQSKIYKATLANPKGELFLDLRGNQTLPAFSKNQVAFITDIAGRPDLFTQGLGVNGRPQGKPRQLFSAPRATQATPTYSPDGRQIAFVSDKDGPPRVYVMGLSDVKPRLVTRRNRENTSPSWSPDGKKLAYSAKVDGVRQIWIYDFATDEEVALTTGEGNKENPSWAPNSFHLVYNTESEESCELYLAHLNGAEPIQILKTAGHKRFASWEKSVGLLN